MEPSSSSSPPCKDKAAEFWARQAAALDPNKLLVDYNANRTGGSCDRSFNVSLISEPKPANIVLNELSCEFVYELRLFSNRDRLPNGLNNGFHPAHAHAHTHAHAHFQNHVPSNLIDDSFNLDYSLSLAYAERGGDNLCSISNLGDRGVLFIATERCNCGLIDTNQSLTKWIPVNKRINPQLEIELDDYSYHTGKKQLIDVSIDNKCEQLILLTYFSSSGGSQGQFQIETYIFCSTSSASSTASYSLVSEIEIKKINSFAESKQAYNFVRLYIDESENSFILIDKSGHKVCWFNRSTLQLKRCVKSPDGDSIFEPSGLALISELRTLYVCSKKGMLICKPDEHPVKHQTVKPVDIQYSSKENCVYFIDENALYRSRIKENLTDEHRYKLILTNKSKSSTFRRLVECAGNYLFIMLDEDNKLLMLDKRCLK
jgi:hypothetical protein